jgi:hypothetical protein
VPTSTSWPALGSDHGYTLDDGVLTHVYLWTPVLHVDSYCQPWEDCSQPLSDEFHRNRCNEQPHDLGKDSHLGGPEQRRNAQRESEHHKGAHR